MTKIAEACLSLYNIGLTHGFMRPESIKLIEGKSKQISYKLGNFDYLEMNNGLQNNNYPKFFIQLQKKVLTQKLKTATPQQKREMLITLNEIINNNVNEKENQTVFETKDKDDSNNEKQPRISSMAQKNITLIKLKKLESSPFLENKVSNEGGKDLNGNKRKKSRRKSEENDVIKNTTKNKVKSKVKRNEKPTKTERSLLVEKISENSDIIQLDQILHPNQKRDNDEIDELLANLKSPLKPSAKGKQQNHNKTYILN